MEIKKLTKKQISKIANNEIGKSPYHKTFTAYKYSTKTGFDESIIKETCIEAYKIDDTRLIAAIAQNTSGSVYVKLIDTYWKIARFCRASNTPLNRKEGNA